MPAIIASNGAIGLPRSHRAADIEANRSAAAPSKGSTRPEKSSANIRAAAASR
jgi:hypothetical protein